MKIRALVFLVFFIAGVLSFYGCHFSVCSMPTYIQIDFEYNNIQSYAGDSVLIVFYLTPEISNNGELGDLIVTDENDILILDITYSGYEPVKDSILFIIPDDVEAGQDVIINFEAMDSNSGLENVKSFVIEIIGLGLPIVKEKNKTANFISTTLDNEMMFDLTNEGVVFEGGNFNNGELAFVWQNVYGYGILSPNAEFISTLYFYHGISYTTEDKEETKIMIYDGKWEDLTSKTINKLTIISDTVSRGGMAFNSYKKEIFLFLKLKMAEKEHYL